MGVKIAYLLLVHDYLENLVKITNRLKSADTRFYIHIDKKVDITPYKDQLKDDSIFFVEDRVSVQWAGYSQNEAVLKLFEIAYTVNNDYFILLSGHDYPVYGAAELVKRLNPLEDYYSIWNYDLFKTLKQKARLRYTKYHLNDISFFNPKYRSTNKLLSLVSKLAYYSSRLILYSLPDRKFNYDFILCKGSTWMGLKRDSVKVILGWMSDEHNYPIIKYLKHSSSSDEVLFHSILYNAGIHPKNVSGALNVLGLHYVDWDWLITKKPNVLSVKDFDAIVASNALFARKLEKHTSDKLIEKIDAYSN